MDAAILRITRVASQRHGDGMLGRGQDGEKVIGGEAAVAVAHVDEERVLAVAAGEDLFFEAEEFAPVDLLGRVSGSRIGERITNLTQALKPSYAVSSGRAAMAIWFQKILSAWHLQQRLSH
jgi:hypothetical protein